VPRPERVEAFRLGPSAESRAALLLIAKAYRIPARRWKTPFGEIDIVASRGGVLVCVEEAVEAVTERSKRRIVGAAELRRARHPDHANGEIRFDVIAVTPGMMPRHIANAFDARVLTVRITFQPPNLTVRYRCAMSHRRLSHRQMPHRPFDALASR
jgi:putative endonuclease